VTALTEHF